MLPNTIFVALLVLVSVAVAAPGVEKHLVSRVPEAGIPLHYYDGTEEKRDSELILRPASTILTY
ncbi:hypothetical protein EUX98_g7957 [Antrodiella citrinella]|uniref:Uncharacterized protein n=1 Tax=Antrodiella citrinella TaxID=2447956 RepID=A0A4S4MCS0_9APHY|nr:hypothetical protein EUX98_g7957 [Antrodiella citrinella]